MNPGLSCSTATCSPPAVTPARPVGTRPHLGRQHLARRLPDLGAQTQPRAELLAAGPLAIRADLAQQHPTPSSPRSPRAGQPSSPGTPPPPIETRAVGLAFPPAQQAAARRGGSCSVWRCVWICSSQTLIVGGRTPNARPPASTRRGAPPSRSLAEPAPSARRPAGNGGRACADLVGSRSPARMAWIMLRAGLTRDVGDGLGQFDVDLLQGLLHVLDGPATLGDQPGALARK